MADDALVTISGSYRKHLPAILECRREFVKHGARVVRPSSEEVVDPGESFVRLVGDPTDPAAVQAAQLNAIRQSDLLYVVNPGGYVGSSAIGEVYYAYAHNIPVIYKEPAFENAAASLAKGVGSPRFALAHVLVRRLKPADRLLAASLVRGQRAPDEGATLRVERVPGQVRLVRMEDDKVIATRSNGVWTGHGRLDSIGRSMMLCIQEGVA